MPTTFAAFVAARRRGGRALGSLLIAPVQRVCRYPLLFKALLKRVPAGHPDRAALEGAAAEVNALAARVNEDRRTAEAQLRVYDLGARTRPAADVVSATSPKPLLKATHPSGSRDRPTSCSHSDPTKQSPA